MGNETRMKMILDLDTGIDDALALGYALGRPDIELLGVTNIFGNVTTDEAARNTLDLLHLMGHDEVKVYKGSAHALDAESYEPSFISRKIHGDNGLGNVNFSHCERMPEEMDAVAFMAKAVHTWGNDLTIVATGPLTNIARLFREYPETEKQLGNLVIMGGAVTTQGNVTPYAEANILGDIPAAKEVLESRCRIHLVGLDVTMRTLLTAKETQQMKDWGSELSVKMAEMIEYYFGAYKSLIESMEGCPLHDPLAVGIALEPSLARTLKLNLTVNTEGEAKGRTIGDWTRLLQPEPNVSVCIDVDADRFLKDFMEAMERLVKGVRE